MPYRAALLPPDPDPADLLDVASDYEIMSSTVMAAIADRCERRPDDPYLDTKLDLITGEDFSDGDPIRGHHAVYGWIQGRGLEALAGHAERLRASGADDPLRARLDAILVPLLAQVRRIRDRNHGRLSFFMLPDGTPFTLGASGRPIPFTIAPGHPYGFSDLFTAKGMFAAAIYLDDDDARSEALEYVDAVERAIFERTFRSDQISLDPKNPVEPREGYHPHGPYMIQIGAAALLVEHGVPGAVDRGLRLIDYELSHHVNLDDRIPEFEPGDFWEAVDDTGNPYRSDGVVISDPGHALECVGLAGRFLLASRNTPLTDAQSATVQRITKALPLILARNFENGFLEAPGGICKVVDLVTRKRLNTDLPWWPLPETIRSAACCLALADNDADRAAACRVFAACHNAFTSGFVRPDLHLMAYQTRDETGTPVSVIPATADADPGYHTGLSLLNAVDTLRKFDAE